MNKKSEELIEKFRERHEDIIEEHPDMMDELIDITMCQAAEYLLGDLIEEFNRELKTLKESLPEEYQEVIEDGEEE